MGDIIRPKHGPEWHIQKQLVEYLTNRGWYCEVMHGNAFQRGVPDLWLWNQRLDLFRWVDVKHPTRYSFTKEQRDQVAPVGQPQHRNLDPHGRHAGRVRQAVRAAELDGLPEAVMEDANSRRHRRPA